MIDLGFDVNAIKKRLTLMAPRDVIADCCLRYIDALEMEISRLTKIHETIGPEYEEI
jgi:hypothetical protein